MSCLIIFVLPANTAHNGSVNGLAFTADGLHLITFGTDNRLRLWNTASGRNTLVNYGKINNESKKSVHLTVTSNCIPDLVYVPDDGDITVLDIYTGEEINTLRGHYAQVIHRRSCSQSDFNFCWKC